MDEGKKKKIENSINALPIDSTFIKSIKDGATKTQESIKSYINASSQMKDTLRILEEIPKRYDFLRSLSIKPIDVSFLKSQDHIREENAEERHQETIEVLGSLKGNIDTTNEEINKTNERLSGIDDKLKHSGWKNTIAIILSVASFGVATYMAYWNFFVRV